MKKRWWKIGILCDRTFKIEILCLVLNSYLIRVQNTFYKVVFLSSTIYIVLYAIKKVSLLMLSYAGVQTILEQGNITNKLKDSDQV